MTLNRRQFLKGASALSLAGMAPAIVRADIPHVVVVGGGFGGSTVAKYLKMWGSDAVNVTLVDPNPSHTSCVMSNLVLNKQLDISNLQMSHGGVQSHGVYIEVAAVNEFDPGSSTVTLDTGKTLKYTQLVLAPGIAMKPIYYSDMTTEYSVLHAWIAGDQTVDLADAIDAMANTDDQKYLLSIPSAPYRCPPGPYERACVVANIVKNQNRSGKVIVLDANPNIIVEEENFKKAFALYADTLEYHPGEQILHIGTDNHTVHTVSGNTYTADVLNLIPNQTTPAFMKPVVADGKDFAEVDPETFESMMEDNVYIIGDACSANLPKSAHMANSQAKVCADAILRTIKSQDVRSLDRLANLTVNSACFSPITATEATFLSAVYQFNDAIGFEAKWVGASNGWSTKNYKLMYGWANNLFADSFDASSLPGYSGGGNGDGGSDEKDEDEKKKDEKKKEESKKERRPRRDRRVAFRGSRRNNDD